jgi:hypothetical protein
MVTACPAGIVPLSSVNPDMMLSLLNDLCEQNIESF